MLLVAKHRPIAERARRRMNGLSEDNLSRRIRGRALIARDVVLLGSSERLSQTDRRLTLHPGLLDGELSSGWLRVLGDGRLYDGAGGYLSNWLDKLLLGGCLVLRLLERTGKALLLFWPWPLLGLGLRQRLSLLRRHGWPLTRDRRIRQVTLRQTRLLRHGHGWPLPCHLSLEQ